MGRILETNEKGEPFWSTASPEEWVASLLEWMNRPRPSAPMLPDEAISRESIYD